jgi:hypothetical protein
VKKVLLALAAGILCIPDKVVSTSHAQPQVDVNINIGGRGRGRGITCGEGRRIVERRGFRNVRVRNCSGNTFRYSGRRRGDDCRIEVRRRDGRIVGIRCR